jgi:hypothetical protein
MTCHEHSFDRLAGIVLDTIADSLGVNVLTYRHGRNAEGGWDLVAWSEQSSEAMALGTLTTRSSR